MTQAAVAGEIQDNTSTIRTDKPGVKVSWQVTGVRQDPWANAHRIVPETDKNEDERDYNLHPHLHDQPDSRNLLNLNAVGSGNP
jgi:hypothetical protein